MNNTNMNTQPNGMDNVPQNQQPMYTQPMNNMGVQPQQPVQPAAPKINMGDVKAKLSSMNNDHVKRIVGIVCGCLLLLAVFIPYMSTSLFGYSISASIWSSDMTMFKIFFIILALIPIITYFFERAKRLSYITAGYALSFDIYMFDSVEGFSGLAFGFWLIALASIALIVINVIEDLPEIKSMFATRPATPAVPVGQMPMAQQVQQVSVQPVVQNVEVCRFCGQPKKNPADQFCQGCGQRY